MNKWFLYTLALILLAISQGIKAMQPVLPSLFINNKTEEPVVIQIFLGQEMLRDGLLAPAKKITRIPQYRFSKAPSLRAGALQKTLVIYPHSAPKMRLPLSNTVNVIEIDKNIERDTITAVGKSLELADLAQIAKNSIVAGQEATFIVENTLNEQITVNTYATDNENIKGDANILIPAQSTLKFSKISRPFPAPGAEIIRLGKYWYWKEVDQGKRALMGGYINNLSVTSKKEHINIPVNSETKKVKIIPQGGKFGFLINPPELAPGIMVNVPQVR